MAARDVRMRGTYVAGRDIVFEGAKPSPQALFQLPPDIPDFTDRERALAELREALEPADAAPAVSVVAGTPGVGKSTLAIHLAHALRGRFPDAQLYVDLRGGDWEQALGPRAPSEVLAGFLRALGIEDVPEKLDERVALYRAQLADKQALVVLDNARREDDVRCLIPAGAGCAVLVTSRSELVGLEGARARTLEVLGPDAALELLGKLMNDRPRLEREREAAGEITRLCGHLPLAVRIAGARLRARPRWDLARLVERLKDERRRLDELEAGDREVRASFALSYHELEAEEARLFRRLGVLRGPDLGVSLAAALLQADPEEAEDLLERLVDVQLLEPAGEDRYGFHDLLRLFARERLEQEENNEARQLTGARALRWYLDTAKAASTLLQPAPATEGPPSAERRARALTWYDTERANLVAAIELADLLGNWDATWRLAAALTDFFALRADWEDWRRTDELALDATRRAGDRHGEGLMLHNLAGALYARGDIAMARDLLEQALELRRQVLGEDHPDTLTSLNSLALTVRKLGDLAAARALHEQALKQRRQVLGDDHPDTLESIGYLATTLRKQGDLADARALHEQALELRRQLLGEDHPDTLQSLSSLAKTVRAQGHLADARALHEQALELRRQVLGDNHPKTLRSLSNLAEAVREVGDLADARDLHEQALKLRRQVLGDDHRDTLQSVSNLATVLRAQGDLAGARALEESRGGASA